jgi:hypothetical protein
VRIVKNSPDALDSHLVETFIGEATRLRPHRSKCGDRWNSTHYAAVLLAKVTELVNLRNVGLDRLVTPRSSNMQLREAEATKPQPSEGGRSVQYRVAARIEGR